MTVATVLLTFRNAPFLSAMTSALASLPCAPSVDTCPTPCACMMMAMRCFGVDDVSPTPQPLTRQHNLPPPARNARRTKPSRSARP